MSHKPMSLDHVNIFVRNAERSHRWYTASLDDLAEIYRRLGDKGVAVRVADHTVSIGVYFSDPDGNGLEVYYELPRSEWHQERPFTGGGAKGRFPGPWDEALRQPALANG